MRCDRSSKSYDIYMSKNKVIKYKIASIMSQKEHLGKVLSDEVKLVYEKDVPAVQLKLPMIHCIVLFGNFAQKCMWQKDSGDCNVSDFVPVLNVFVNQKKSLYCNGDKFLCIIKRCRDSTDQSR